MLTFSLISLFTCPSQKGFAQFTDEGLPIAWSVSVWDGGVLYMNRAEHYTHYSGLYSL